ncbi:MAG TPA: hypothetical protein DCG19_14330 [Cryomorphaceae bacterium]|nr:hypothetical protein [Owenweeksia sp.]MBF98104.1 hypothetical protein [Owenweeksia sp.]HAD98584.1 hypothetical protein [Cryomorphaceae bacterium]HBF18737.1 hypothetical protein [Cryomorphaceae bacterium]|tara:strand:+ start:1427 stop:1882 length:456 start_codon:yes stop_codon:yes gene_type:complete
MPLMLFKSFQEMEPTLSHATLEIEDAALDWKDAVESHHADKVMRLYSEDAVLMCAFTPHVYTHREELRDYFDDFLRLPALKVNFLQTHIRFIGDGAVNSGIYRFDYNNGEAKASLVCRYTFALKRIAGQWRIETHHSSILPQETLLNLLHS